MKMVSQETNIAFIFLGVLAAAASMLLKDFRPLLIVFLIYIAIVTWVAIHTEEQKNKGKDFDKIKGGNYFANHCDNIISVVRGKYVFKSGVKYSCYHLPSMETHIIIGVSKDLKKVCAAGWPPSVVDMIDCISFEEVGILDEAELRYREKTFGTGWL